MSRKRFEAFKCKFEPFERDSKLSNANCNHWKGIRSFEMQILTIRKGFEAFKSKLLTFERNSKHSNANSSILVDKAKVANRSRRVDLAAKADSCSQVYLVDRTDTFRVDLVVKMGKPRKVDLGSGSESGLEVY